MPEPVNSTPPELPGRAVATQRWAQVTFLHWRVAASVVAPLLPEGVRPDEHDGSSWVGLIAFQLEDATLFGSPPGPYFGTFAEVNVRLYGVDETGRRGVVFRSLEASRLAAVLAARVAFSIPYVWSQTSMTEMDGAFDYRADRHFGRGATRIRARAAQPRTPDATDEFLTARWGLFTRRFGRTVWLPNTHAAWPLRACELLGLQDTLVAAAGIPGIAQRPPDSVLFSDGVTARFGRSAAVPVSSTRR